MNVTAIFPDIYRFAQLMPAFQTPLNSMVAPGIYEITLPGLEDLCRLPSAFSRRYISCSPLMILFYT